MTIVHPDFDQASTKPVPTLPWTGERCVPEATPARDMWVVSEHVARYRWAQERIAQLPPNRVVVDVPSGSGYGTAMLASCPNVVISYGVDIDSPAVAYANARYAHPPRLTFHVRDMEALRPASANVIVCFEGIEHVTDQERAARSLCHALKSGGLLLVSTPRADGPAAGSPFHTHELLLDELVALFAPHLSEYVVHGQDSEVGDAPVATARYFVLEGRTPR